MFLHIMVSQNLNKSNPKKITLFNLHDVMLEYICANWMTFTMTLVHCDVYVTLWSFLIRCDVLLKKWLK
jgi:hypothetical protein